MKKFKILPYAALFSVFLLAGTMAAFAQENIEIVHDAAFENQTRPPVAFAHDAHNEKAGIDDCGECHHASADGEKQMGDDSVGMECSQCHYGKPGQGVADLIRAYHLQCAGCHGERKAGPVLCGECHRRR